MLMEGLQQKCKPLGTSKNRKARLDCQERSKKNAESDSLDARKPRSACIKKNDGEGTDPRYTTSSSRASLMARALCLTANGELYCLPRQVSTESNKTDGPDLS